MPTARTVLPESPGALRSPAPTRPAEPIPQVATLAPDGVPERLTDRYGRHRARPASVHHGPLQPALHLLHARAGAPVVATPDLLTTAELARLGRIAVERLGVERIRLTGGEPLLRRDLEEIIGSLSALRTRQVSSRTSP